ncbi:MAG: flagellar hook capping FlgD N-terminal domain-containing protein [Acidimicrobiales bacterium]
MTLINSATAAPSSLGSSATTNPLQGLSDPMTFLKLLVAQLKYQDPLNPMSGTQFMSQTAQLTQVETMTNLAAQVTQELNAQQTMASTSMIGKQISAKLSTGVTVTGLVQSVSLDPTTGPTLSVNGTSVPLSTVQTVSS